MQCRPACLKCAILARVITSATFGAGVGIAGNDASKPSTAQRSATSLSKAESQPKKIEVRASSEDGGKKQQPTAAKSQGGGTERGKA